MRKVREGSAPGRSRRSAESTVRTADRGAAWADLQRAPILAFEESALVGGRSSAGSSDGRQIPEHSHRRQNLRDL